MSERGLLRSPEWTLQGLERGVSFLESCSFIDTHTQDPLPLVLWLGPLLLEAKSPLPAWPYYDPFKTVTVPLQGPSPEVPVDC